MTTIPLSSSASCTTLDRGSLVSRIAPPWQSHEQHRRGISSRPLITCGSSSRPWPLAEQAMLPCAPPAAIPATSASPLLLRCRIIKYVWIRHVTVVKRQLPSGSTTQGAASALRNAPMASSSRLPSAALVQAEATGYATSKYTSSKYHTPRQKEMTPTTPSKANTRVRPAASVGATLPASVLVPVVTMRLGVPCSGRAGVLGACRLLGRVLGGDWQNIVANANQAR